MRFTSVAASIASQQDLDELEQAGRFPGYYLRCQNTDKTNHWLGESLDEARANLDRVADRFLAESFGWRYDIEYSHGRVVNSSIPWANVSAEHLFT